MDYRNVLVRSLSPTIGRSASDYDAHLFLKPEPFFIGSISVAPPQALSLSNIKRIVTYVKSKDQDSTFPSLSYGLWKYVALKKMHLPEDLAFMYFETYHLLKCKNYEARINYFENFAACRTHKDREQLRQSSSADCYEFVLLLYLQHVHKNNIRNPLRLGDEWASVREPVSRTPSPDPDAERLMAPSKKTSTFKSQDELEHMQFFTQHLSHLLKLLCDSEGPYLTMEGVRALGFIVAGRFNGNPKIYSLDQLALLLPEEMTGFSKQTSTFEKSVFENWLRQSLKMNPHGVKNLLVEGRRLKWILTETPNSQQCGRLATNAVSLPSSVLNEGYKLIVLAHCSSMIIARERGSGLLPHSSIRFHRCNRSFHYFLAPLRSVLIERCQNSTIVLGPVETVVYLNGCENVTLICPCHRVYVGLVIRLVVVADSTKLLFLAHTHSASKNCTLYLLTNTQPLILSHNDQITLAPYNTFYPRLLDDLREAGISERWNLWNRPVVVQRTGAATPSPANATAAVDGSVVRLIDPKQFHPFSIPFQLSPGSCSKIPSVLPRDFANALYEREATNSQWKKWMRQTTFTSEQKQAFRRHVTERFQEWLNYMGYHRELELLNHLEVCMARQTAASNTSVTPSSSSEASQQPVRKTTSLAN